MLSWPKKVETQDVREGLGTSPPSLGGQGIAKDLQVWSAQRPGFCAAYLAFGRLRGSWLERLGLKPWTKEPEADSSGPRPDSARPPKPCSAAARPDLVDDLHASDGLPEEQGHQAHVQAHMDFAGDQVALLDQRDQGGGKGDQAGHGDPHQ